MASEAEAQSSFIRVAVNNLEEEKYLAWINLQEYSEYFLLLEKIRRYKPYTLGRETEKVLALAEPAMESSQRIFTELDVSDFDFGTLEHDGEKTQLTHGNFSFFLQQKNRNLRAQAFSQYYRVYHAHRHAIACALSQSAVKDSINARIRGFSSCREACLFSDRIPESFYDNLLGAVSRSISPLKKYFSFRKKSLGLDKLFFYDTYVPLVSSVKHYLPYEEAVKICVKACAVFGDEYCRTLEKGLLCGWVDRYERPGKMNGAYSGGCYDSPPYILLNYRADDIGSLYTLMHEAGHSMHTWYAVRHQPFQYYRYSIFEAEVASTCNEILLTDYLLKNSPQADLRLFVLNKEIDEIRATFYRQTMFAEFEHIIHMTSDRNDPLTLDFMTEQYRKILYKYFENTIEICENLSLEYLRIPHFYSAFYVYKYVTGIISAIDIATRLIAGERGAVQKYLAFLKLGGSCYPLESLQTAGTDLNSDRLVENAARYFAQCVEKFSALLNCK